MIRKAKPSEYKLLTCISQTAKMHWGYPHEWLEIWREELTISSDYILDNQVFIRVVEENVIAGFCALVELRSPFTFKTTTLTAGLWLDHMFIEPQHMGKGYGKDLFYHCIEIATDSNHDSLHILADPNSAGFYSKVGCVYQYEVPSTIPNRTTPYFIYQLS